MKVHTMRKVFLGLFVVVIVLFLIGFIGDQLLFSGMAAGILLASGLCLWVFWRCPHCGKNLGALSVQHCPHCGARLEVAPGQDPYDDVKNGRKYDD